MSLDRLRREAHRGDVAACTELLTEAARRADTPAATELLETLLALWRQRPWPALGEAIEHIAERFESEPARALRAAVRGVRSLDDDLWHALETDHGALERGALLDTLHLGRNAEIVTRIERVQSWPPDPRTATAIATLFTTVPFRSRKLLKTWRRLADTLVACADPRSLDRLQTARSLYATRAFTSAIRPALERIVVGILVQLPQPDDTSADPWQPLCEVARSLAGQEPAPQPVEAHLEAALESTPTDEATEAATALARAETLHAQLAWSFCRAPVLDVALARDTDTHLACVLHKGGLDERYRVHRSVWLGELDGGRTVLDLDDHHTVAMSPDGQTLAAARGYTVDLYDTATGQRRQRLTPLIFDPTGILTDDRDPWPLDASRAAGRDRILDLAFSPDGRHLAVLADYRPTAWDTVVTCVVDLDDPTKVSHLQQLHAATRYHWEARKVVRFDPEGRRVGVTAGRLWTLHDLEHDRELARRDQHDASLSPVSSSAFFASAGPGSRPEWLWLREDGQLDRVDADTGEVAGTLTTRLRRGQIEPWPDADGALVMFGADGAEDIARARLLAGPRCERHVVEGLPARTTTLAWHASCGVLVTGDDCARLRGWQTEADGRRRRLQVSATTTVQARLPAVEQLGVSHDGAVVMARVGELVELSLRKPSRGGAVAIKPKKFVRGVSCALLAPDGEWLAIGTRAIKLYPTAGGRARSLAGHRRRVTALAAPPTGQWLASGGEDAAVHVWSTDDEARSLHVLGAHAARIVALAAHPGGELLASLDNHDRVVVWDAPAGRELARHDVQGWSGSPIRVLVWAAGGDRLLVLRDTSLEWLDPQRGEHAPIEALAGHEITAIARHPDVDLWALGTAAGRVLRWQPGDAPETVSEGHTGAVRALAFSRDRLFVGCSRGDVDATVVELRAP